MAVTPTLQDLISQLPPALGQGIMSPAEQQASIDQIMAATMPAALRKYGTTSQDLMQKNFDRGFGQSSYQAYQQALNSLMEQEGAAQIRNQAQNSVDAAQKAAIGNAVNYATAEQNRAATAANQKRQISANRSSQNRAAIYSGLGNLGGGTAGILARDLMRPEGTSSNIGRAIDRLKGAFSLGGDKGVPGADMGGTYEGEGQGPSESPSEAAPDNSIPDYTLNTGGSTDFGTGNLSDYSFNLPDFEMPDFSLESLFGGFNNIPGNFWDQEF